MDPAHAFCFGFFFKCFSSLVWLSNVIETSPECTLEIQDEATVFKCKGTDTKECFMYKQERYK